MSNRKRASTISTNVTCPFCADGKSLEEVIALTSESVKTQSIEPSDEPQFNIDQFVVHTKHELCSLEDGFIEKGVQVFVCGLLGKLITDDIPSDQNKLPVKMIGNDKLCVIWYWF